MTFASSWHGLMIWWIASVDMPQVVQVHSESFAQHYRDLFSPDWKHLAVEYSYPQPKVPPSQPPSLETLLQIAELLGRHTDFVRVDLYAVGSRVLFGELANFPGVGRGRFHPASFDVDLGRYWNLPRTYNTYPRTMSEALGKAARTRGESGRAARDGIR